MSISSRIRKTLLKFGIEVNRLNPSQSIRARLQRQFKHHQINLVLDVGANDGGYASEIRESGYQEAIVSFEPLTHAHAELVLRSEGDQNWHVSPRCALGAAAGTSCINIARNSTSSSLLPMLKAHVDAAPHSSYERTESVEVKRLDQLGLNDDYPEANIFLKLDVQGFEMSVLNGCRALLPRIMGIQVECSVVPLYAEQALYRELFDWMADNDFELWGLVPGFTDRSTGRMLQMDGVFFRSDERSALKAGYGTALAPA